MKTVNLILIATLFVLSFSGCNDGNEMAVPRIWSDVYGNRSGKNGPTPGFTYYLNNNGDPVRRAETNMDLFFSENLIEVSRHELDDDGNGPDLKGQHYDWVQQDDHYEYVYLLPWKDYKNYQYTDEYGKTQFFTGSAWISPSGIIYSKYDVNIYNFGGVAINIAGGGDDESRDSIESLSTRQKAIAKDTGIKFAKRYALSEDTGIHIAQTLQDYATLVSDKKDRSRTEKDIQDFTRRLSGVDLGQAVAALDQAKNGDKSGIMSLNQDVAVYWGTSPETSARILKNWFKEELK